MPDFKVFRQLTLYRLVDRGHIDIIRILRPLSDGSDQLEKQFFHELLQSKSDVLASRLKELSCIVNVIVFKTKRNVEIELFRRFIEYRFFFCFIQFLSLSKLEPASPGILLFISSR